MMNPVNLIDLSFCVEIWNIKINIKSVANSIFLVLNEAKHFAPVSCKKKYFRIPNTIKLLLLAHRVCNLYTTIVLLYTNCI